MCQTFKTPSHHVSLKGELPTFLAERKTEARSGREARPLRWPPGTFSQVVAGLELWFVLSSLRLFEEETSQDWTPVWL